MYHYSVKPDVTFSDALRFWVKLGFISFGGPAGQIAIMQRELVDERKWVDADEFLHALNFCMLLPGPEAQQLATYCGWRLHGVKGGLAAGALFVLPSVFFLFGLSIIYAMYGTVPQIAALLYGFKAVVVAIVLEAVVKIARKSFKTATHVLIAAGAFVSIYFFAVPFPIIVFAAAIIGAVLLKSQRRHADGAPDESHAKRRRAGSVWKVILTGLLLWLVPLVALLIYGGLGSLPVSLYIFFSQAALVTFGGAYAVLAYVNQAVVTAGWVSTSQAVDGLALAETTPGPLIMVLQFIGFMAGWNVGGNGSLPFAILCGLVATYATFLPSFVFIFVGAPYVDSLRSDARLNGALTGVMASVVGVIATLAVSFASGVLLVSGGIDYYSLAATLLAFFALAVVRMNVLLVVVLGGLFGLLRYLLMG